LRSGPNNSAQFVGELSQGTTFAIACQTRGERITDSRGYRSDVWNRTRHGGQDVWVSDVWSGHKGWMSIPCGTPGTGSVCPPTVPSVNRGVADTTLWNPDACSGVFLRNGLSNSNDIVGELKQGAIFDISCQVRGGSVTDSTGW